MIATILPASANFNAVKYNDRKVSDGLSTLLEIRNFGNGSDQMTTSDKMSFLQLYSSRNDWVKKPQFHVAISCKGREMSDAELLEFAHKYLKEMGYAEKGQPVLIYSHHDTDNNHLHIVTSRIAPNGKKIAHDHERRRSQEVIDKILGNDRKKKVNDDLEAAKQYAFSSFAQFKSVMTSMGYEAYQKNGKVYIKHGGKVQNTMPLAEIESLFVGGKRDWKRCRQLRGILQKYRDISSDKTELQHELKQKFGIDLVFFGRKDSPYGYMVVDHANKTVINGARVLATEELLDFATPEQRLDRAVAYVNDLLAANQKIGQFDINKKLRKYRAYIKKGVIHFGDLMQPLEPEVAQSIDRNNRIGWVEKFHPINESERDVLAKIFKVEDTALISLSSERSSNHEEAVNRIRSIFDDESIASVRLALKEAGFIIREGEDLVYAINFSDHTIVNLTQEQFDLTRLNQARALSDSKKSGKSGGIKPMHAQGGSHDSNREWEVGRNGSYDDVDDGRTLRR